MGASGPNTKFIKIEPINATQGITDIHIGVFFDGTNNNMVQTARFTGTAKNTFLKIAQSCWFSNKRNFWYIADRFGFRDEENVNADLYSEYKKQGESFSYTGSENKGVEKGYSNIAILHDNYLWNQDYKPNDKKFGENPVFKHFYIEGSGATDTSNWSSKNLNGLGFGLGDAGVTALVSKAVKHITNYVDSLGIEKEERCNVVIHFYVFGFSRGATCARLFSRIATREAGEKIARENEFGEHYAKNWYDNGFLYFLNDKSGVKTSYYKRQVDFLGIYDTVVSIGFLKQKDGDVHPIIQKPYKLFSNYVDNSHYMNVNDYGLYLKDLERVNNICHICAMDEYRENFAITDLGSKVVDRGVEVFVPGCHADVGGGYVDWEEEQEIVLCKRRDANTGMLKVYRPWTWVGNINEKPDNEYCEKIQNIEYINNNKKERLNDSINNKDYISEETLIRMGIIDSQWDKCEQRAEDKLTMSVEDEEDSVKFKRHVKGGYSNITLHMMIEYAHLRMGNQKLPLMFVAGSDIINYQIPEELKTFGGNMVEGMKSVEQGRRVWFFPKSDKGKEMSLFDNEFHKKLRLEYIHFTSTSELFHVNNPFKSDVHFVEGEAGNLGNTPNFDMAGKLCRIVYHGDKDDKAIHYMYDYPFDIVQSISHN